MPLNKPATSKLGKNAAHKGECSIQRGIEVTPAALDVPKPRRSTWEAEHPGPWLDQYEIKSGLASPHAYVEDSRKIEPAPLTETGKCMS